MSRQMNMLVGVRLKANLHDIHFSGPSDTVDYWDRVRQGLDGIVIDAPVLSGPIYLHQDIELYFARCRCGEISKKFKARTSKQIMQWANEHRCDTYWGVTVR